MKRTQEEKAELRRIVSHLTNILNVVPAAREMTADTFMQHLDTLEEYTRRATLPAAQQSLEERTWLLDMKRELEAVVERQPIPIRNRFLYLCGRTPHQSMVEGYMRRDRVLPMTDAT